MKKSRVFSKDNFLLVQVFVSETVQFKNTHNKCLIKVEHHCNFKGLVCFANPGGYFSSFGGKIDMAL